MMIRRLWQVLMVREIDGVRPLLVEMVMHRIYNKQTSS
jgi:hypothetical protein